MAPTPKRSIPEKSRMLWVTILSHPAATANSATMFRASWKSVSKMEELLSALLARQLADIHRSATES